MTGKRGWRIIALISAIVFLLFAGSTFGSFTRDMLKKPDPGNKQMISLTDGSKIIGEIVEVTDTEIVFESGFGRMNIAIVNISEIKEIPESSIKGGKYWFPNPNATRLFFAPNGKLLRKGQGYLSNWYLFFPGMQYGVTNNFSIGGGFSIFPGLDFFNEQALYLTPKVGFSPNENLDLALSALIINVPAFGDDNDAPDFFGILYGMGTMGSNDHNFTLGLGYGYADDEIANKPVVILGGETRVSRRISLLGESWILPEVDEPLLAYGARFYGEGLSVDLAFLTVIGEGGLFPGIPYVGFVYNF